ncbi:hypothetical protein [Pedobacter ginsengisoli]|uniref:hypothetical protein n=1 Tax=Pedobacter ginsengisoli TaxID=363852 RepID=UPI00254F2F46|nr:hypothetical protein [Pedobacter ginsengisoli]
MKTRYAIIIASLVILSACRKEDTTPVLNTDIRIVNTALDLAVKVDPGWNLVYSKQSSVASGKTRVYSLERKSVSFKVVNAADTTVKLYEQTISFNSPLYTMYVIGQAPTFEAIVKEENNFPFIAFTDRIPVKADSVVNVRFINLSPNSVPLKVKIVTVTGNEVDNLPYKEFGVWKKYTATAASTIYSFQLRDATSDVLITTFNFTANATNRFKNVSLIVKGLQGTTTGTNAFGVMTVNHF